MSKKQKHHDARRNLNMPTTIPRDLKVLALSPHFVAWAATNGEASQKILLVAGTTKEECTRIMQRQAVPRYCLISALGSFKVIGFDGSLDNYLGDYQLGSALTPENSSDVARAAIEELDLDLHNGALAFWLIPDSELESMFAKVQATG